MTWGECKLICLQTMFANEGIALNADDSNQDYLYAMPGKANEAMHQLATVGRPLLKRFWINIREGGEEAEDEEQLTLPAAELEYQIDMTHYCPRFRTLVTDRLYLDAGNGDANAEEWRLQGDSILCLPGSTEGRYTVWYAAYPALVSTATEDEFRLDLPEEAAALVPLYMAGELYKEDELAMATVFRNEFEDGLAKLRQSYQESAKGGGFRSVRNTTGWW